MIAGSHGTVAFSCVENLAKRLAADGISIENLAYTATTVQVRIRNGRIDAGSQAIGRTARALSHVMPASVEVFEIVPVVNGIGASKVTIRRSDTLSRYWRSISP